MDNKRVAELSLTGGMIVLVLSIVIRLGNMLFITEFCIPGLIKLSMALLLVSIAASLENK